MLKSLAARSLVADRAAQQVSLGRLPIGFNRLPRASRFAGAPPYRNEMADASSRFWLCWREKQLRPGRLSSALPLSVSSLEGRGQQGTGQLKSAFYNFARAIASVMKCRASTASPQPLSFTHLPGSRSL